MSLNENSNSEMWMCIYTLSIFFNINQIPRKLEDIPYEIAMNKYVTKIWRHMKLVLVFGRTKGI